MNTHIAIPPVILYNVLNRRNGGMAVTVYNPRGKIPTGIFKTTAGKRWYAEALGGGHGPEEYPFGPKHSKWERENYFVILQRRFLAKYLDFEMYRNR